MNQRRLLLLLSSPFTPICALINSPRHFISRKMMTKSANLSSSTSSRASLSGVDHDNPDSRKVKIAAVQMCSTSSKQANLERCAHLVQQAAGSGAQLVCLPECCLFISGGLYTAGPGTEGSPAAPNVRESADGPSMSAFKRMASSSGVWLSVGSFPEDAEAGLSEDNDKDKGYNLQVLISPEGRITASYRKIHLFDSPYSGLQESKTTLPGDEVVVVDTGFARIGLSTCYDLRFPELYAALRRRGAELLLAPSAFTHSTGRAHWEVLCRARAIENQCYLVAAAQTGKHNDKRESYGQTMIIDPWGRIESQLPAHVPSSDVDSMSSSVGGEGEEGICYSYFDREKLQQIRTSMPVHDHKRSHELYDTTIEDRATATTTHNKTAKL